MSCKRIFSTGIVLVFCGMLLAQTKFYADDSIGCSPFTVKFSLDYTTIDTTTATSVDWDFGNGQTITSFNPPAVTYSDPGTYTVSIVVDGNTGSPITKTDYIVVHETVPANFDYEVIVDPLSYLFSPTETITTSTDTYYYRWSYYNDSSTLIGNITYIVDNTNQDNVRDSFEFSDTGYYQVALSVRSSLGCSDSVSQIIHVQEAVDTTTPTDTTAFVVGNVFAPESEGFFIIDPDNPNVVLSFKVFSRTGVLVYQEESPIIYWDGRTNSGRDLLTGVYFYVLEATVGDPDRYYSTRGFIHLFR